MYDEYEMQTVSLSFTLTLFIKSSALQLVIGMAKKEYAGLKVCRS